MNNITYQKHKKYIPRKFKLFVFLYMKDTPTISRDISIIQISFYIAILVYCNQFFDKFLLLP